MLEKTKRCPAEGGGDMHESMKEKKEKFEKERERVCVCVCILKERELCAIRQERVYQY